MNDEPLEKAPLRCGVPVVREDLYIERRSVHHGAASEISGNRTLVIPLSSERVFVTKCLTIEEDAR